MSHLRQTALDAIEELQDYGISGATFGSDAEEEQFMYTMEAIHGQASLAICNLDDALDDAQSRADTLAGLLADAGRLLTAAQCADASIEAAWGAELDEWCKRRDAALSDGDGERGSSS